MGSDNSMCTQRSPFFIIPTECRVEIYKKVFSGVRLDLDKVILAQVDQEKSSLYARKLRLIKNFNNQRLAIIFTCRQVLDEAMEILARVATLQIKSVIRRQDPTAILSAWFLGRVPTMEVDVSAFVHVDRKRMMALKDIVIVKTAEGDDTSYTGHHILNCQMCGGTNARLFIDVVMQDTLSWQWMKDQIVYLAKEEGWNPVLSTRLEYTMDPANNYLEVLVDFESYQATQKRGVWNGQVLELDDWFKCFQRYVHETYGP